MALSRCPRCGLRYDSVKSPGGTPISTWDGPVMVNPCTCVVAVEYFRERDPAALT